MKESGILKLNEIDFVKLNTVLKQGGVICFVTDTVWGLGCLPESEEGIEKIYEIKGRDRSKPLILMSDEIEHLKKYVKKIPENAKIAIKKFLPGALTVILEKSELCSDSVTSNMNTVGIRVPDNNTFREICKNIEGHVLATTSANKSGEEPVKSAEEAVKKLGSGVDYVIDDMGEKPKGTASTVAIFNDSSFKILRQGEISL